MCLTCIHEHVSRSWFAIGTLKTNKLPKVNFLQLHSNTSSTLETTNGVMTAKLYSNWTQVVTSNCTLESAHQSKQNHWHRRLLSNKTSHSWNIKPNNIYKIIMKKMLCTRKVGSLNWKLPIKLWNQGQFNSIQSSMLVITVKWPLKSSLAGWLSKLI